MKYLNETTHQIETSFGLTYGQLADMDFTTKPLPTLTNEENGVKPQPTENESQTEID
jgi:hypothetical protein